MARQVYYDPFGMRVQGEQAGVRDEAFLQDQTRRARASDWEFNNMNPLQLAAAQRADTLGQAALPYDMANLGLKQRMDTANLANAELGALGTIGQATGQFAPYLTRAGMFANNEYLNNDLYNPLHMINAGVLGGQAVPQLSEIAAQYGVPQHMLQQSLYSPFQITPGMDQGADEYFGFGRALQLAQQEASMRDSEMARRSQWGNTYNDAIRNANTGRYYDWLYNRDAGGAGQPADPVESHF